MPKVTLKKIAETLGLSTATVSKALKDYDDISPKTKLKVKELANSLNYKPNSFAQSLRNQESKIIGLIIPEIVHHFFANIILGVIKTAEKNGYLVITLQSDESYKIEKKQIELLLYRNVDGILISLADNTVNYKHINEIRQSGVPVVLYDKISKSIDCHRVVIDDQKAAFNATKHLIDIGCKKIAHVRGALKPQTTIDRFIGYKNALKAHNIPFDNSIVFETDHLTFEDGRLIADEIALKHRDIDGVNDGDLAVLGKGIPDFELGWTNQIQYKNWDINAFFRGAFGHSLINTWRAFYEPRVGSQGSYNFINTELANPDIKNAKFSSHYVEKADFFKLDNLSIGYTFDISEENKYLKGLRVSLSGQNLFTITNYTGSDPEPALTDQGNSDNGASVVGNFRDPLTPGIDRRYNYFSATTITLGVNINF